jgi:hypothetical protein
LKTITRAREVKQVKLTAGQMHNKVYHLGENRPVKQKGGVSRCLLAAIGNISLHVCDARPGMTFELDAGPDEVVLFFLDGCALFEERRLGACPSNSFRVQ